MTSAPFMIVSHMRNPRYELQVWNYAFGQYRLMLLRPDMRDGLGYPTIVRQMCTYKIGTVGDVVAAIREHEDPEAYCESLARWYNCEHKGGRIRLDNTEEDRKYERPEGMS